MAKKRPRKNSSNSSRRSVAAPADKSDTPQPQPEFQDPDEANNTDAHSLEAESQQADAAEQPRPGLFSRLAANIELSRLLPRAKKQKTSHLEVVVPASPSASPPLSSSQPSTSKATTSAGESMSLSRKDSAAMLKLVRDDNTAFRRAIHAPKPTRPSDIASSAQATLDNAADVDAESAEEQRPADAEAASTSNGSAKAVYAPPRSVTRALSRRLKGPRSGGLQSEGDEAEKANAEDEHPNGERLPSPPVTRALARRLGIEPDLVLQDERSLSGPSLAQAEQADAEQAMDDETEAERLPSPPVTRALAKRLEKEEEMDAQGAKEVQGEEPAAESDEADQARADENDAEPEQPPSPPVTRSLAKRLEEEEIEEQQGEHGEGEEEVLTEADQRSERIPSPPVTRAMAKQLEEEEEQAERSSERDPSPPVTRAQAKRLEDDEKLELQRGKEDQVLEEAGEAGPEQGVNEDVEPEIQAPSPPVTRALARRLEEEEELAEQLSERAPSPPVTRSAARVSGEWRSEEQEAEQGMEEADEAPSPLATRSAAKLLEEGESEEAESEQGPQEEEPAQSSPVTRLATAGPVEEEVQVDRFEEYQADELQDEEELSNAGSVDQEEAGDESADAERLPSPSVTPALAQLLEEDQDEAQQGEDGLAEQAFAEAELADEGQAADENPGLEQSASPSETLAVATLPEVEVVGASQDGDIQPEGSQADTFFADEHKADDIPADLELSPASPVDPALADVPEAEEPEEQQGDTIQIEDVQAAAEQAGDEFIDFGPSSSPTFVSALASQPEDAEAEAHAGELEPAELGLAEASVEQDQMRDELFDPSSSLARALTGNPQESQGEEFYADMVVVEAEQVVAEEGGDALAEPQLEEALLGQHFEAEHADDVHAEPEQQAHFPALDSRLVDEEVDDVHRTAPIVDEDVDPVALSDLEREEQKEFDQEMEQSDDSAPQSVADSSSQLGSRLASSAYLSAEQAPNKVATPFLTSRTHPSGAESPRVQENPLLVPPSHRPGTLPWSLLGAGTSLSPIFNTKALTPRPSAAQGQLRFDRDYTASPSGRSSVGPTGGATPSAQKRRAGRTSMGSALGGGVGTGAVARKSGGMVGRASGVGALLPMGWDELRHKQDIKRKRQFEKFVQKHWDIVRRQDATMKKSDFAGLVKKGTFAMKAAAKAEGKVAQSDEHYMEKFIEDLRQRAQVAQNQRIPIPHHRLKEYERLRQQNRRNMASVLGVLGRPALPTELTPEQNRAVDQAFRQRGKITELLGASVSDRDLAMLRPGIWLNDESMNMYGTLILRRSNQAAEEREKLSQQGRTNPRTDLEVRKWSAYWKVHFFNTLFMPKMIKDGHKGVARWTLRKGVNLFTKDIVLIPINNSNIHWTCGAINIRRKRFEYYDSMAGGGPGKFFEQIRAYLAEEHRATYKGAELDLSQWTNHFTRDSPMQNNGNDCGVFAIQTLEQLSRRNPRRPYPSKPPYVPPTQQVPNGAGGDGDDDDEDEEYDEDGLWNFSQKNIEYLRRRMVYEIAQAQLLDT
ncbi:hypothetical protein V8E36_002458 [Tilletia maclaganii]